MLLARSVLTARACGASGSRWLSWRVFSRSVSTRDRRHSHKSSKKATAAGQTVTKRPSRTTDRPKTPSRTNPPMRTTRACPPTRNRVMRMRRHRSPVGARFAIRRAAPPAPSHRALRGAHQRTSLPPPRGSLSRSLHVCLRARGVEVHGTRVIVPQCGRRGDRSRPNAPQLLSHRSRCLSARGIARGLGERRPGRPVRLARTGRVRPARLAQIRVAGLFPRRYEAVARWCKCC